MTAALIALTLYAAAISVLFVAAAMGGNQIRDDLRRRIDGLNAESARKTQVIDWLAEENNRLRGGRLADVRPITAAPSFGRIVDILAANEAQRALDNDARIQGWLDGGDVS